jgi:hypothetical protein
MNVQLRTYFGLVLNCLYPVIRALDFVFANGKVQDIWPHFARRLGISKAAMNPGEIGKYKWGVNIIRVFFMDHSFDVRVSVFNWKFQFGDANILDKMEKACQTLEGIK